MIQHCHIAAVLSDLAWSRTAIEILKATRG